MKVFSYDDEGYLKGEIECQPSPLEPGEFLVPAKATKAKPPKIAEGKEAKFVNDKWEVTDSRVVVRQREAAIVSEETAAIEVESKKRQKSLKDFLDMEIKTPDDMLAALQSLQQFLKPFEVKKK